MNVYLEKHNFHTKTKQLCITLHQQEGKAEKNTHREKYITVKYNEIWAKTSLSDLNVHVKKTQETQKSNVQRRTMHASHPLGTVKSSFVYYADFSPILNFMNGLKSGSTEIQCYRVELYSWSDKLGYYYY